MKITKKSIEAVMLASLLGFSVAGISGCESQGPFEEAGEEIDDTVDEVEDEIDERR